MSENTTTAADDPDYGVRGHYAYSRICDGLTQEEADAEYDEWLAEHDRQVAVAAIREWADYQERVVNDLGIEDIDFAEAGRWIEAARRYADKIVGGERFPKPMVPEAPMIGKRFKSRDRRDHGRVVTVLRVSKNQMRAGLPAKSTVYDCQEHDRVVRIQEHILATKWREL